MEDVNVSYLDEHLLKDKLLQIMPSSFYNRIPQEHLSLWGHKRGIYGLPTTELIEWLNKEIVGSAIEVGAGNGALGRALGIPITDKCTMKLPEVQFYYKLCRQPLTEYPDDIIEMDGLTAIDTYKPDTVIGSWITHQYKESEHLRGGSAYGIDEAQILPKIKKYIMIGNTAVHSVKPILDREHKEYRFPWLYSRSMEAQENIIYVWERDPV